MCQCPGRALTGAEMESRKSPDGPHDAFRTGLHKALEPAISLKPIIPDTV